MRLLNPSIVFIFLLITIFGCKQPDNSAGEIEQLLNQFLSTVDSKETHDRFWAEDLIYTSSSGTRFGKDEIMSGFEEEEISQEETSSPKYSAEDVTIKVFDDLALLTFQLVAVTVSSDSTVIDKYLNSGTLIKRGSQWKVINWQATKAIK